MLEGGALVGGGRLGHPLHALPQGQLVLCGWGERMTYREALGRGPLCSPSSMGGGRASDTPARTREDTARALAACSPAHPRFILPGQAGRSSGLQADGPGRWGQLQGPSGAWISSVRVVLCAVTVSSRRPAVIITVTCVSRLSPAS